MKNKIKVTLNNTVPGIQSPAVAYRLHEGTKAGTPELEDFLSNSGDMTLNGTGTPFASDFVYDPNGTDDYLSLASATYISALLRFDTLFTTAGVAEEIIIALRYLGDGDQTGTENLISFGNNNAANSLFAVAVNGSEQVIVSYRGVGASSIASNNFSGAALDNTEKRIVISIHGTATNVASSDLYYDGISQSGNTGLDLVANGGAAIDNTETDFQIGARNNGGSPDRFLAGAASNATINDLFICRRSLYDSAKTADFAAAFYKNGDVVGAAQEIGL